LEHLPISTVQNPNVSVKNTKKFGFDTVLLPGGQGICVQAVSPVFGLQTQALQSSRYDNPFTHFPASPME